MVFLRLIQTYRLRLRELPRPRVDTTLVLALGCYSFAAVLTLLILLFGTNLHWQEFRVPHEYRDDALLILPLTKSTVETGTHWRNERLGYPGVQETYDFPIIDHWHFAWLRILGFCGFESIVVHNLYHYATYPLTTIVALFVLRQLGISSAFAIALSLLYAFQSFHMRRGQDHYFLAAYYLNPLAILAAIRIADPSDLLRLSWRAILAGVTIAILLGTGGAYYAFFACALLAAATIYGTCVHGRRSLVGGVLLISGICLVGLIAHAPTIHHQLEYGRHSGPYTRTSIEAEEHGFRLVQLFLPNWLHNSDMWLRAELEYRQAPRVVGENSCASLGVVASVGLIGLLGLALRPNRSSIPHATAVLAWVGVLVGMSGGLGGLFAVVVWAQVRSYNRISIFLAFLGLFAVGLALDRVTRQLRGRRLVQIAFAVVLLLVGLWDQVPRFWFSSESDVWRRAHRARFKQDAEFFAAVESVLPRGSAVLNWPYVPWPEKGYEHVRGYLHTHSLKWSFGAIQGREADTWHRELIQQPLDQALLRAIASGFNGLLYDQRLERKDQQGPTRTQLETMFREYGVSPIVHADGQQFFWDLKPIREGLVRTIGDGGLAAIARHDSERVRILFLDGFDTWQPYGREMEYRWFDRRALVSVVNPSTQAQTIRLESWVGLKDASAGQLKIASDLTPTVTLNLVRARGQLWQAEYRVPPGTHLVQLRFTPSAPYRRGYPSDTVHLSQFRLTTLLK